jgi:hypothetical protein
LTVLERAELINEWRKLVEEKRKAGQIAHPGGDQPHNKDVSGTARELEITREEVRRAAKMARISADTLLRIRDKGLDDNQSALLKIADEPPEKQLEKVDELAIRKPRGQRKKPKSGTSATGAGSDAALITFAEFILARIEKIREVMTAEEKVELNALAECVRSAMGQHG